MNERFLKTYLNRENEEKNSKMNMFVWIFWENVWNFISPMVCMNIIKVIHMSLSPNKKEKET